MGGVKINYLKKYLANIKKWCMISDQNVQWILGVVIQWFKLMIKTPAPHAGVLVLTVTLLSIQLLPELPRKQEVMAGVLPPTYGSWFLSAPTPDGGGRWQWTGGWFTKFLSVSILVSFCLSNKQMHLKICTTHF